MRRSSIEHVSKTGNGSVASNEVMTLREFGRRLGLGVRSCRGAERQGLQTITFGRSKYVLGEDVIAWFRRLAEEQKSEGSANQMKPTTKQAVVRHLDETEPIDCPFGHVRRVVTGGEGGVANIHVVQVTKGTPHIHAGYDEVYYVLSGSGTITLDQATHPLRPGSVAIIPAGVPHSLEANAGEELEFVIFGTPPMAIEDERAKPRKVSAR